MNKKYTKNEIWNLSNQDICILAYDYCLPAYNLLATNTPRNEIINLLLVYLERQGRLHKEKTDHPFQKILVELNSVAKNIQQKLKSIGNQEVIVRENSEVGDITQEQ